MPFSKENKLKTKKLKPNCYLVGFTVSLDHRLEVKEGDTLDKYLDLIKALKNTEEHISDDDTNRNWSPCNSLQKLVWKNGWTGNPEKNWDYPDHSTVKISQKD